MTRLFWQSSLLAALLAGHAGAQAPAPAPNRSAPPAPAAPSGGSKALLEELKAKYGEGFQYAIDDKLKLVFATNTDAQTLEAIRSRLSLHAAALQRDLFTHPLADYLTVVIPKEWKGSAKGLYSPETRSVTAKSPGIVLIHEFTHALHFADQQALGQFHQNWIIEGLGALYESSRIIDGHSVPQSSHRLKIIQGLAKNKKHVPFETYVQFDQKAFMKAPGNHYSQARYMLLYLFEKGVLKKWYDAYTAGFAGDPTGGKAMEKALGKPLAQIEADWLEWVVALPPFTGYSKEDEPEPAPKTDAAKPDAPVPPPPSTSPAKTP